MLTSPPVTRGIQTRERILAAAQELLAQGGREACSMREVAQRSGVTAGAIYRHFRDKDALIEQVVVSGFHAFERTLTEAIVSLPVGSFARIAALGDAYLRYAEEHAEEFKILFNPMVAGRKKVRELPGQGGYAILRRCIVEAMGHGAMKEADPDLVAFFLWSRVHGIVMLLSACDFQDEMKVEGGPEALNLFQLTRAFITSGLGLEE